MKRSPYTERIFAPVASCLTVDVARRLVELRIPAELEARLEHLAAGEKAGSLTAGETDEYQDYIEAIDVVGVIQSQAMKVLDRGRG
jgi:ribosome maturation protein Sdo1